MTCDRSVFFRGIPVSSTNKTYLHDITEILLKVALSAITLTLDFISCLLKFFFFICLCTLDLSSDDFMLRDLISGIINYTKYIP